MLSLFTLSPNRRKQSRSYKGRRGGGAGADSSSGAGTGGGSSSDEKSSLSRKSSQAGSFNSSESDQALLLSRKTRGRQTIPATPSPPPRHRLTGGSNSTALPLSPPGSETKKPSTFDARPTDLEEALELEWRFASTSIPLVDAGRKTIKWGLMSERDDVILGLEDLGILVQTICAELSKRGLETPLLFSSLAVNLSCQKIKSLVRTYVASVQSAFDWTIPRPTPQEDTWTQEILLSGERELAWVLRWALARVLQLRERNEEKRGLADLDQYAEWRKSERAADHPQTHIFAFAAQLGTLVQPIFVDLLTLFSKLVAHSHLSGCTPPVIGGLFGPLIFGLPVTLTFVDTQKHFVKSALATEHLLLSFIRSQSFASLQKNLPLPLRLQSWTKNYPTTIVSEQVWLSGEPRKDGRSVRSELIRKDVRAYSAELFRTAESWVGELERASDGYELCGAWVRDVVAPVKTKAGSVASTRGPRFASDYRKRLNIPSTTLPSYRVGSHGSLCALAAGEADDDDDDGWDKDEGGAGWETLAEKKWGFFAQDGFDFIGENHERSLDVNKPEDPISGKLQFDLTESSRAAKMAEKRASITWNDFSNTGFPDSGITLSDPLDLFLPIQKEITNWPEHREQVYQRLKSSQKNLPAFDYDVRPRVYESVTMEEAFVDAWADLLFSAGWMNRVDPTARECNWAIVQYKTISRKEDSTKLDTLYVVFEEIVPIEYQRQLVAPPPRKPINFNLFNPRRSKQKRASKDPVRTRREQEPEPDRELGRDEKSDPAIWRDRSTRQHLVFQRSYSTHLDSRTNLSRSHSSTAIDRSELRPEPGIRPRAVHGSRSEPSLVNIRKGLVKSNQSVTETPGKGEKDDDDALRKTRSAMTREAVVRDRIDRSMYAFRDTTNSVKSPVESCADIARPVVCVLSEPPEPGPKLVGSVHSPTPVVRVTAECGDSVSVGPTGRSIDTTDMIRSEIGSAQEELFRVSESGRDRGRRGEDEGTKAGVEPLRIFPRPDVRTDSHLLTTDPASDPDEATNDLAPLGAPLLVCSGQASGGGGRQEVVPFERPVVAQVMPLAVGVPMYLGEVVRPTRPREEPSGERRTTDGARSWSNGDERTVRVLRDPFVPVSSYVHGQPLHNLLEEEEEEEEDW